MFMYFSCFLIFNMSLALVAVLNLFQLISSLSLLLYINFVLKYINLVYEYYFIFWLWLSALLLYTAITMFCFSGEIYQYSQYVLGEHSNNRLIKTDWFTSVQVRTAPSFRITVLMYSHQMQIQT